MSLAVPGSICHVLSRLSLAASIAAVGTVGCVQAQTPAWAQRSSEPSTLTQSRMSLGRYRREHEAGEPDQSTRRVRDCRKFRHLGHQLGESIAGHRVRQTLAGRSCGLAAGAETGVWDWPWTGGALTMALPPRVVGEYGDWQVRCEASGTRQRCALIHRPPIPATPVEIQGRSTGGSGAINVHFVIDTIASRESVLWRIVIGHGLPAMPAGHARAPASMPTRAPDRAIKPVEGQPANTGAGRLSGPADRVEPGQGGETGDLVQDGGLHTPAALAGEPKPRAMGPAHELRYALGGPEIAERFAHCSAIGCLVEVGPRRASEVGNRLWEGRTVEVRIADQSGATIVLTLPGNGFRAGLRELNRLRREEERGSR